MTTLEIIDQMAEILLAGAETTSGILGCLFLQIARHPAVKQKLMDSLPILTANDPIISGKEIRGDPQYVYLNACLKECLRINPIAFELGRRTGTEWKKIMGVELPPHTVIGVCIWMNGIGLSLIAFGRRDGWGRGRGRGRLRRSMSPSIPTLRS